MLWLSTSCLVPLCFLRTTAKHFDCSCAWALQNRKYLLLGDFPTDPSFSSCSYISEAFTLTRPLISLSLCRAFWVSFIFWNLFKRPKKTGNSHGSEDFYFKKKKQSPPVRATSVTVVKESELWGHRLKPWFEQHIQTLKPPQCVIMAYFKYHLAGFCLKR